MISSVNVKNTWLWKLSGRSYECTYRRYHIILWNVMVSRIASLKRVWLNAYKSIWRRRLFAEALMNMESYLELLPAMVIVDKRMKRIFFLKFCWPPHIYFAGSSSVLFLKRYINIVYVHNCTFLLYNEVASREAERIELLATYIPWI